MHRDHRAFRETEGLKVLLATKDRPACAATGVIRGTKGPLGCRERKAQRVTGVIRVRQASREDRDPKAIKGSAVCLDSKEIKVTQGHRVPQAIRDSKGQEGIQVLRGLKAHKDCRVATASRARRVGPCWARSRAARSVRSGCATS